MYVDVSVYILITYYYLLTIIHTVHYALSIASEYISVYLIGHTLLRYTCGLQYFSQVVA